MNPTSVHTDMSTCTHTQIHMMVGTVPSPNRRWVPHTENHGQPCPTRKHTSSFSTSPRDFRNCLDFSGQHQLGPQRHLQSGRQHSRDPLPCSGRPAHRGPDKVNSTSELIH